MHSQYGQRRGHSKCPYMKRVTVITGAQPKAGTGLKMQSVSVFFSTLHC